MDGSLWESGDPQVLDPRAAAAGDIATTVAGSYDAAMRTVQETAIHIPPHLERLADVAAADLVVHSVVFYGSRSVQTRFHGVERE